MIYQVTSPELSAYHPPELLEWLQPVNQRKSRIAGSSAGAGEDGGGAAADWAWAVLVTVCSLWQCILQNSRAEGLFAHGPKLIPSLSTIPPKSPQVHAGCGPQSCMDLLAHLDHDCRLGCVGGTIGGRIQTRYNNLDRACKTLCRRKIRGNWSVTAGHRSAGRSMANGWQQRCRAAPPCRPGTARGMPMGDGWADRVRPEGGLGSSLPPWGGAGNRAPRGFSRFEREKTWFPGKFLRGWGQKSDGGQSAGRASEKIAAHCRFFQLRWIVAGMYPRQGDASFFLMAARKDGKSRRDG